MAIDCPFEELVVGRIAAKSDALDNRHQLRLGEYALHIIEVERCQPRRKIGPLQNLDHLLFGCDALEQSAEHVEPSGDRPRPGCLLERRADEDVGIDDKPHPRPGSTSF
jgi:hypothetical protein